MPFESTKQRRHLYAVKPDIAKKFAKDQSARKSDVNGWYEIKGNPLSNVGVFPYTGAMIDSTGEFGLDPNKIYNVLRSKDELSSPDTIESFKLVPWVDEHTMLGKEADGLTPAERKGVSGVIGESVFFDDSDGMLKGNVKLFSENLKNSIESGKRELSLGYRCKYIRKTGIFDGKPYDFEQISIRGNHVASVYEGRMGSDVAVMDGDIWNITIDSKEFKKMAMTPEEMETALTDLIGTVAELSEKITNMAAPGAEDEDGGEEGTEPEKTEDEEPEKTEVEKKDDTAMDSLKSVNEALLKKVSDLTETVDGLKKNGLKTLMSEIGKKTALAENLSGHIGTFDHSEMTLIEVAEYGAKKLELNCEKGSELAALTGYLHNRKPATPGRAFDSATRAENMDGLDDYLKGGK